MLDEIQRIRDAVLEQIDALQRQVISAEEFRATIRTLMGLIRQAGMFSLVSLAWYWMLSLLEDFYREEDAIEALREQILGENLDWHPYAFRYDLRKLFTEDERQLYEAILRLVKEIVQFHPENKLHLLKQQHDIEALTQPIRPVHIGSVLLSHIASTLTSLPSAGSKEFNLLPPDRQRQHRFSTILPIATVESVSTHLDYVNSLLEKLEGKQTLFVDVGFARGTVVFIPR